MEYARIKSCGLLRDYTLTCATLFSMFSNLDVIDEFVKDYPLDYDAKGMVESLERGLGRNVHVNYEHIEKNVCNRELTNNVVVCFSGGKDSVATALKLRDEGRNVILYHITGINRAYPDELSNCVRLSKKLGLPLHVEKVSQKGKTSFKESPVKNQLIASMCLEYSISHGLGVSVAFGDFNQDCESNSSFFESWSDTREMWNAWVQLVQTYVPNAQLIIPFNTYNETLDIISEDIELLNMVHGCLTPYRFQNVTRLHNIDKYKVDLLNGRCGSCWKCCTEYIFLVDKGVIPINEKFYFHCLDFLVKKLPTTHPEINELSRESAYNAFLHMDFSKSIINK